MKLLLSLISITFLTTTFISNAFANDLPPIQSGYWETVSSDGNKFKHCVDSKSMEELFNKSSKMMQGTCKPLKVTKNGDKYISNISCNMLGSTMTVTSEITGDFKKEYFSKTVTKFEPPFMGKTKDTSSETTKLISTTCPDGMVAGDIETNDGKKMNANKMVENMPNMQDVNKLMEGLNSGNIPDQAQLQKMIQEMQKNMGQ